MVLKPFDENELCSDDRSTLGENFIIENNVIKGKEQKYNHQDENIGQMIYRALSKNPQHVGQIDAATGQKFTFTDMKDKSVRLAIWMQKGGVGPNDIVSLCSPDQIDVYSVIFATFFVGATYNPLDHEMNLKSARSYISVVKPKVIITYEDKIDILQEAANLENHVWKMIVLGKDSSLQSFDEILQTPTEEEIENFKVLDDIDPESINLIAFSSGTTGAPKAVAHSYGKVMKHVVSSGSDEEMKNHRKYILTYFFPAWAIHMWFMLDFVLTEATQIYHDEFDPHDTCKIIEKYQVNVINLHTYKLTLLCNVNAKNKYNLNSIETVVPIGTKLSIKSLEETRRNIPNAFISRRMGMTETGEISRFTKNCRNPMSEGIVRPNVQVKIIDIETGETLGPNRPGELCAKTPTTMLGYYKNPRETQFVFDNEGWLHSGDEAYYDMNGELVIVGRLKEIIKYRYYDVHPAYVEEILISHPNITDAAVVGVPHEIDLERPFAFVRKLPGTEVSENELIQLVSKLEFNDLLKGSIMFVDEIPRTTNGKMNKHILKELAKKFTK